MSLPPWNAEETITSKENRLSYKIRKIFKEPPSYRQNLPHDNVLSNCGTLSKISKSVIKSGLFFYMTVCKCHLKNCKNQISKMTKWYCNSPYIVRKTFSSLEFTHALLPFVHIMKIIKKEHAPLTSLAKNSKARHFTVDLHRILKFSC